MRFTEVADRVWVARYAWFDVNVTAIGGEHGLLVVDTHASTAAAGEVVADLRALGAGDVVAIVNTHEHFDHTFGNAALRAAYGAVPIHAHEDAAAATVSAGERIKQAYRDDPADPRREEVLATEIVAADHTFSSVWPVDLGGGRVVELVHPGKGHTSGDVVVRVPDADVMLTGDLVEESGVPGFGQDCHPMEWPLALDLVLNLTGPSTVVVPGHGAPVGKDFMEEQRSALGVVAETIRDLSTRGVPVDDALAAAEWPYPREDLVHAVRRGYEHLPRAQRNLPLV
ncbi:MBL fold metallo-hydrolase [Nocardioides pacificus]